MLPTNASSSLHVLVVDDDPVIRQLHTAVLTREGYAVTAAAEGPGALEAVGTGGIDLVLLDSRMPGMSGLEVLAQIRSMDMTVPVVLVTGATDLADRVEGLELGADDYVAKPVEPSELVARVRALLRGRRAAVEESVRAAVAADRAIHDELRAVIDDNRFHPVFQPIVDLRSRETVAYEALTRFDDGRRPDLCFADAQRVGLGIELALATLAVSIEHARSLPAHTALHLNVAPDVLAEPALAALLATCGREVVVELTEHDPIEDYEITNQQLAALGQVRTAVDDAGAGYSSMAHVLALDPDEVKLDREWVRGVDVDVPRQALIAGVVTFATATDTLLVAEGVETEDEALALQHLGVTYAQGFHLGRPQPVAAVAAAR